jgi:DNA-binding CsgD family transcriptional regulator
MALVALSPWIGAVILNFIRRFRRRRARECRVLIPLPERELLETRFGSTGYLASIEARLFLERLAARAQVTDRRLLELLLTGHTLSEAARRLGISHGSEQFHLNRVREAASALMNAGRRS